MSTSPAIAILVSGLPGSGKTFFAKRFAPAIGAAYFSTDIMRKTLTPERTYSPMEKATVYTAMMERMDHSLRAGQTVVLDATFYKEDMRADFVKAAHAVNSKVLFIEVRANKSVVRDRLSQVREDSDADYKVYLKLRDLYEPIKEPHLVLHSDKNDVEELVSLAIAWVADNR